MGPCALFFFDVGGHSLLAFLSTRLLPCTYFTVSPLLRPAVKPGDGTAFSPANF
jgi:hypothetical protein